MFEHVSIFSDSQVVLDFLNGESVPKVFDDVVADTQDSIRQLASTVSCTLFHVNGHDLIFWNEVADRLARQANGLSCDNFLHVNADVLHAAHFFSHAASTSDQSVHK
eukprot:5368759-Karenia_brevis.AAC.1